MPPRSSPPDSTLLRLEAPDSAVAAAGGARRGEETLLYGDMNCGESAGLSEGLLACDEEPSPEPPLLRRREDEIRPGRGPSREDELEKKEDELTLF